ncbi:MAG: hypothetical protein ACQEVA_01280 [Myxococcota bacterium]
MPKSIGSKGNFECNGEFLELVWYGLAEPHPYDVLFVFGDEQKRVSNHYFGLTDEIRGMDPSESNTMLRSLSLLLQTWRDCVGELQDGQRCLLLYGFWDEYISAAQLRCDGEEVDIRFGWLDREGYAVNPSDAQDYSFAFDLFEVDVDANGVRVARKCFLDDLSNLIACVDAHR